MKRNFKFDFTLLRLTLFIGIAVVASHSHAHVFNCGGMLLKEARYWAAHYDWRTEGPLSKLDKNLPTLVVVDGLSSGADYAVRARQLFPRLNIIHVQTAKRMAPGLLESFQPTAYDVNLVFDLEKLSHLARLLEPFKKAGLRVVAGTETSPKVRSLLTDRLGVPGTSLLLADALTDKHLAAKAVSPYVKTIPGNTFSDPVEAWEWTKSQEGMNFPIMVKPIDAAGGYGVTACHSKEQFFAAFASLRRRNPLGLRSAAMLVQPYFSREEYTEYVIDVVVDPETGVTLADVLQYKKKEEKGKINYLSTRLVHLAPGSLLYEEFLTFARGVAKGLSVQDGVLHIEVFVKNNTNPPELVFVEAGARPAGGGIPKFVRACGGNDMITLHLYSMFDRKKYLELIKNPLRFDFEGVQIDLLGPSSPGIVTSVPDELEFKARIPGFLSHDLHMKTGGWAGPALDLFQGPGVINIVGTKDQVDGGETAVRNWEADGLYRMRRPTFFERLFKR